jgi:hypothetical protein
MGIGFWIGASEEVLQLFNDNINLKSIRTGIEPLFGSQNCKGRIEFAIRALQEG